MYDPQPLRSEGPRQRKWALQYNINSSASWRRHATEEYVIKATTVSPVTHPLILRGHAAHAGPVPLVACTKYVRVN
jgi:hypothetical protein